MTTNQITAELDADEAATLDDPIIRSMAKAAVSLAEKTAPGNFHPYPGLPRKLYGDLIDEASRIERLKFVARMRERPDSAICGYFTREDVMLDVTAVMRRATK